MTYSVVQFRGSFYIKGEEGDRAPDQIGPYRYEADARKAADELNEKLKPEASRL